MYIIHFPVDGHLGCIQLLAIMNKASTYKIFLSFRCSSLIIMSLVLFALNLSYAVFAGPLWFMIQIFLLLIFYTQDICKVMF